MTYIYRIENQKGESCYSYKYIDAIGVLLSDKTWNEIRLNRIFPEYDNGIERKILKNEICGFVSVRQLLKWFKSWEIKRMKRLGFEVKRIPVQKITARGERQCLAVK